MKDLRSIVLMGLRASGKSTIGAHLAATLDGFEFQDLDRDVLADADENSIAEIVEKHGWDGFRLREYEQLQIWLWGLHHLPDRRLVLSLGGGTPTHEPSLALLQSAELHGMIRLVYLRAQPHVLASRMEATADRPSLTGEDPALEIERVFAERDELYRSVADAVIDVDDQSVEETAKAVVGALQQL